MRRIALLLLSLLAALPAALAAQEVTGTVVDAQSGAAVPGALVSLVSSDGRTHARALADAAGRFTLRADAAGRYQLRAERVGYAAATSPPLELAAGETTPYRLAASAERVQLEAVVATGGGDSRRCTARPGVGEENATLWDEARKALQAAVATREQYPYQFRTERRIRLLDAATLGVRREEVRPMEQVSESPFVAVSPEHLAERGYVEKVGNTLYFHAPDAAILLSDPFLASHCFRSRRGDRDHPGMVGLGFEPVRSGPWANVEGVLWLDARTAELRAVEYRYTAGSRAPLIPDRAGGRVEFRRLPNGAWIVNRWRILMPSRQASVLTYATPIPTSQAMRATIGEESGQVVEVRAQDGTAVELAVFASIAGVVWDSTRDRPLAGARVSLAGTADSTRTDAEGRFTLPRLAEGVYALGFDHPRLDSLHFVPEAALVTVVPPEALRRDLAIPSVASIHAWTCRAAPGSAAGAAVGLVTDRAGGVSLSGSPREWTTGRNGELTLDVAPGTYSVAFSQAVYGTGTARLTVAGRGRVQYELKLPRRTVTLEPLRAVAQRVYPGYFDPRSRGRRLNLITRDEIERRAGANDVGGLVRTFPGLQILEFGYGQTGMVKEICIQDRTAIPGQASHCPGAVAVALDDVVIGESAGEFLPTLPISNIESIIYLKPTDGAGRYGYAARNGILLIYTRGNGPTVREQ